MIVSFIREGEAAVPGRWIICWERPPARRGHRPAGKAGGGPGAYRRLALRQKVHTLRRPVFC